MRGLLITFEGPDGAGKTTQMQKLAGYLQNKGLPVMTTREPGGTAIGDRIRALLLNPEYCEMMNETEVLLYAASRAQHVKEKIVPALQKGTIVLCDRFTDASIAYQGYGLGVKVEKVKEINAFATGGLTPDRTYFLDISPAVARERIAKRDRAGVTTAFDRIEQKHLAYHQRVREGFFRLYREENWKRICLLDGERDCEELFAQIKSDFERLYEEDQNRGGGFL